MCVKIKFKEIINGIESTENKFLEIRDGKISFLGKGRDVKDRGEKETGYINLDKYIALPGFIDMHIHGANGFDIMDGSYQALNEISKYLATIGVTSFLGATVTAPLDQIHNTLDNIGKITNEALEGAEFLGVYLEGPYLSPVRKGAHPEAYMRLPNILEIEEMIKLSKDNIRVIAIAPELPGAMEAIKHFSQKGIKIALGHTDATGDLAKEAFEMGASIVIHLFNGMRPFHHREGGLAAAAMLHDKVFAELIADGVHVHPMIMEVLLKVKEQERICLISDCMRAGGLKDGDYMLGQLMVTVGQGVARIENGSLAGSTLNLMQALENILRITSLSLQEAVKMLTIAPALALGLDAFIGKVELGKRANIIVVDDALNLMMTMVQGKIVYMHDTLLKEIGREFKGKM